MDNWSGFGFVVVGTIAFLFLPFLVSLLGRDARLKVVSLGLCIGAMLLTGFETWQTLSWLLAWVFAGLALRARLKAAAAARAR